MSHAHDRPHPTRTLLVLGLAALAFALAQTTLVPAIPELQAALHTDESGVTWTLTGYLLSAAVFTPLVGRLGDIYGKRRFLVISLAGFALGSALAALTSSLWIVVGGRAVMGIGGGIFPLCFGIVRDEFPRDRVARSIGLLSAVVGIGGGLGLVFGGLLIDYTSYRWIFWLGAAMAVVAAVCAQILVPESPVRSPSRLDVRGAAVLAVGLVLPLVAISQAHQQGWGSARTIGLIIAGLAVLAGWVVLQRRTAEPLADVAALAHPPVLMTNIATLLVGWAMFGSFILIPQLADSPTSTGYGFGTSATGGGLLLVPGSLLMLVLGPLSGIVGSRVGNKVPLALGGFVTAGGIALLAISHGSQLEVLAFSTVMCAGIGLAYAAMPNLIIEAVPPHQTGEATGFNALIRSVGGSLGSQIAATVLASSAVAGIPTDSGYTTAFAISAAVGVVAGVVALLIPPARRHHHAPALDEVGAAAPLPEPAYASEDFRHAG